MSDIDIVLTIRERAMRVLAERLQVIDTANGYTFTVDDRVARQAKDLPDYLVTPSVYIYEGDESKLEDRYPNSYLCRLLINVVYLAESYQEEQSVANSMLGDISRAIGDGFNVTFVNSLSRNETVSIEMNEQSNEVIYDDVNGSLIICIMTYELQYRHKRGDQTTSAC